MCVVFQFDGPRGPGQRDDDVIAVVVVIDSGHPCRIGRTRVCERKNTDEAGKKQEDQGTTYSHDPEPTPSILPRSSGGKTSERRAEKPRGKRYGAVTACLASDCQAVHPSRNEGSLRPRGVQIAALTCTKTHDASGRPPGTQLAS